MAGEQLKKITVKAKQIRKTHPKMKWTDAIKAASKQISGIGKTKTKRTVKRKRVAGVRVSSTNKTKSIAPRKVGAIGALGKAGCIMAGIDKMEKKLKSEKRKEMRSFIIEAINAEHDKLDLLKNQLKKVNK
jgi:hypothetical protein